jgi:hypothetical protein
MLEPNATTNTMDTLPLTTNKFWALVLLLTLPMFTNAISSKPLSIGCQWQILNNGSFGYSTAGYLTNSLPMSLVQNLVQWLLVAKL